MNAITPRAGLLLLLSITLGGCVERRFIITSDPTEARVFLNDVDVGTTPCEVDFTYFGTYDVRVKKPGYEPLITKAEAKAPFHEWPGIDLVAMAIPAKKSTIIEWHFTLEPASEDPNALIQRAGDLRADFTQPTPTNE